MGGVFLRHALALMDCCSGPQESSEYCTCTAASGTPRFSRYLRPIHYITTKLHYITGI